MLGRLRNSFAEVDLGALEQNFLTLQKMLLPATHAEPSSHPHHSMMAPMVKADAYGHGDVQVARICERLGARYLGVALVEEGIKLRMAGIQTPILAFCTFDTIGAEAMVKYRITPVVSQFEQIAKLKNVLHEEAEFPVHAKFNTGMQRLGFEPEDALRVAGEFARENYLRLEGVCTHFVSSDDFAQPAGATASQIKIFQKIMSDVKGKLQVPILFHYLNSAGILGGLEPKLDLARPGIALYGALPVLQKASSATIAPVMSVKSFVGFIHYIKKGQRVSYGGTWQAPKDSVIAVVPLGYADGVPRLLSNTGRALVRGVSCPITGIVCMDYLMLDVTGLVEKNLGPVLGDEVVLIGKQKDQEIRVEEVARHAQTISYEILTGMQGRLPRVYIH